MADEEFQGLHDFEYVYKGTVYDDYTTKEVLKQCESFQFRPSDIVIWTYPRTGTSVTQEIVWQIVNNEIIEKDKKYGSFKDRYGFMEFNPEYSHSHPDLQFRSEMDFLKKKKEDETRLIKTHLPYPLLKTEVEKVDPKLIFVLRNPKDTVVGQYHFQKGLHQDVWKKSFQQFLFDFLQGKSVCGDYFQNYRDWWSLRGKKNVLILRYEDIVLNKRQQVGIIAKFLGIELTEEKLDIITHNTSFGTMSKNKDLNFKLSDKSDVSFLRKGVSGDWRNTLTVAQNEALDEVIHSRFDDVGLTFAS